MRYQDSKPCGNQIYHLDEILELIDIYEFITKNGTRWKTEAREMHLRLKFRLMNRFAQITLVWKDNEYHLPEVLFQYIFVHEDPSVFDQYT